MKLKALIFDVDGTLADTEEEHRQAFNEAFHAHGLDWHWSKPHYAQLLSVTGGKERMRAYVATLRLDPTQVDALLAKVPAVHATKTHIYGARVREGGVPLRDGVARLLDDCLRSGVRLAIASTTSAGNIDALLSSSFGPKGRELFCVIGAGDCIPHKKPAPDIYHWVLRELGEPTCGCAAIEDSANGLQAAKTAGLYTIVTPSYWTRAEDFSAADLLLPSLSSAPGIEDIDRRLRRRHEAHHGHS
jgi:beta-phosphoglucomutase-like phosphatase (HAD superfamily)